MEYLQFLACVLALYDESPVVFLLAEIEGINIEQWANLEPTGTIDEVLKTQVSFKTTSSMRFVMTRQQW